MTRRANANVILQYINKYGETPVDFAREMKHYNVAAYLSDLPKPATVSPDLSPISSSTLPPAHREDSAAGDTFDVFISHVKRETGQLATVVFDEVTKRIPRVRCFLDVEEAFPLAQLTEHVRSTKVFVVLASNLYWKRPF